MLAVVDTGPIVPALVIAETTYLVATRLGSAVEARFLAGLAATLPRGTSEAPAAVPAGAVAAVP